MNEASARLRSLSDERLPALPAMLGVEADEILDAAVWGAEGKVVSSRPVQVSWHPGRSLTVSYDAKVAWSKHHHATERFVVRTGDNGPDGALVLARGDQRVSVWRMVDDPALPGLAVAVNSARIRAVLDSLGAPAGAISTQIRAYRPCRRAVVELTGRNFRIFAKVVPPREVPGLQERHRVLAEALPVPRSHGWSSQYGLVFLEALPGRTLRDHLAARRQPPRPREVRDLLDRIPALVDGWRVQSVIDSASEYGLLVKSVVPELGERIERVLEAITVEDDPAPRVPAHGDLHEAQLLVNGEALTGLLDIDTAGLGYRLDDWANLIGHIAVWQPTAPHTARSHIAAYQRSLIDAAEEDTGNPVGLRRRVAAVILGLATGPFRAQSRAWPADTRARLDLAERWIQQAASESHVKRPLIAPS